jgi:hypothetical protein
MSGVFTLLLPKCPVCVLALLQLLGINSALAAGLVNPLFLAFAGIAAFLLAIQAFQLQTWTPFFMYLSGAALLFLGRLYWASSFASIGGVLLLAAGAIWSASCRARNSCSARCTREKAAPRLVA